DGGFLAPTAGTPFATQTPGCTGSLTADTNVTLTTAAGVILYGATGQSSLAVKRRNKNSSIGPSSQPIIFTSRDNVLGLNDDTSQGQWGGVVLMGRGMVADWAQGGVATGVPPPHTCQSQTEGETNSAVFGGNDNAYNAGRMSFVQIRYSGFVLGAGKELQSLTTEGIGTGTILDHFQSHNRSAM